MEPFVYQAVSQRVVFGSGTLRAIGAEVSLLGCSRALVLTTARRDTGSAAVAQALKDHCAGVFNRAAMHTPVAVTEEAMAMAAQVRADCLVSLGGGSAIGLGKAIALRTDLPQIAIPTTYAGSEATPILGETLDGRKTNQRSPSILPRTILYDIDLTLTLPPALSVASGLNALAHAVEALYARERNPIVSILALEGIRALAAALPRIATQPDDPSARSDALYGAWACGTCLGAVGMALHHKICHVLGGTFGMPHAQTHAVILPHAVAYNHSAAKGLLAPAEAVLNTGHLGAGLYALAQSLRAPMSLIELGMPEAGLERACEEIVRNPYWNPRAIEAGAIRRLLDDAFHGRPPSP